eukprot:CAMPEP_0198221630 /NCGR_PEP_ID=MMETSP1445-20131203/84479_1 /TAXON_ID=36898 /ORGANISM="Pyramimonas sp., Strain CCMP2087" /LENGTH=623 /DNA_ID=CAMNT_0043899849 /DNA_START=468 /DNA_END=2336 /DNA_ORIENTATION=-
MDGFDDAMIKAYHEYDSDEPQDDGSVDEDNTVEILHLYTLRPPVSTEKKRALGAPKKVGLAQGPKPNLKQDFGCILHFPEIKMVFCARADGTTAFWDIRSERNRGECHFLRAHKGQVTCLLKLTARPGSDIQLPLVVTASADASLKVWDPMKIKEPGMNKEATCAQTLTGHGGTVTAVVRVGDYLISGSTDRKIFLWRAESGREAAFYPWFEHLKTIATCEGWVNSIHYTNSRNVGDLGAVYAADSTGAVIRFKPSLVEGQQRGEECFLEFDIVNNQGKVSTSSTPHLQFGRLISGRGLSHVLFLAELDYVLTVAYDNKMRIYNNDTKRVVGSLENPHDCPFTDIAYDRVHHQVFLIDKYGFLFVYDIPKEKLILTHRLLTEPLLAIEYNLRSDELGISLKNRVTWWQLVRDTSYQEADHSHSGPVVGIQFAVAQGPDKTEDPLKYVFSCSLDNTVRMWDAYDMACLRTLEEHRSDLVCMRFCESRNTLVTGHDNGTVRLWNLDTASTINMTKHANTVSCIINAVLRRGEEFILTGGFDGRVGIWDIRKKHNVRPHLVTMFEAHAGSEVLCLLHDASKNTIITAGNDTVIKVWAASTYELLGQHTGHTEAIGCLALDANFLFS